jgi:hypothetical protein
MCSEFRTDGSVSGEHQRLAAVDPADASGNEPRLAVRGEEGFETFRESESGQVARRLIRAQCRVGGLCLMGIHVV